MRPRGAFRRLCIIIEKKVSGLSKLDIKKKPRHCENTWHNFFKLVGTSPARSCPSRFGIASPCRYVIRSIITYFNTRWDAVSTADVLVMCSLSPFCFRIWSFLTGGYVPKIVTNRGKPLKRKSWYKIGVRKKIKKSSSILFKFFCSDLKYGMEVRWQSST